MHFELSSIVLILLAAVMAVVVCRRLNIPPMFGYLVAGFVAGPGVMRLLHQDAATEFLGEIGIVFLMFTIGLEFSLGKMQAMRKLVFGLGSAQVGLTLLVFTVLLRLFGVAWLEALALAAALTMSSTAIVSRILSERTELTQPHGQMVMGVLLMQDLAVVPLLILLNALGGDSSRLWQDLGWALLKMVGVLAFLVVAGGKIMQPWFRLIARQHSGELFMLNVLLVTLAVAWFTEIAGLSLALGAFIAGMLMAETEFRFQVEDDIRPFRDILLGFFFITVGMKINPAALINQWVLVLGMVALLVAGKAAIVFAIAAQRRYPPRDSLKTALYLAQGGEFGFVLLNIILQKQLAQPAVVQGAITAVLVSMMLSPFVIRLSQPLAGALFRSSWEEQAADLQQMLMDSMSKDEHVLIIGFGHTGQAIARILERQDIGWYALDLDADRVQAARLAGEPVAFGDAKRKEILVAAGLQRARALVVTTRNVDDTAHILDVVGKERSGLPTIVRVQTDDQIEAMHRLGAESVLSDDSEMGLVISAQIMLSLGSNFSDVFAMMRQVRQSQYRVLDGYFPDSSGDGAAGLLDLHRHALVVLPEAYAVGKTLADLPLHSLEIALIGIRRRAARLSSVAPDFVFEPSDVLLVIGRQDKIARLEKWLLQGG